MTWVKVDDHFASHPKIMQAGPLAGWLHVSALCYASQHLTDGFIPRAALPLLANFADDGISVDPDNLAERLTACRLWERAEAGYQIHDYLEYNPSREEVLAEREMRAVRKDLYADPFLTTRVKQRDHDRCRYCGRPVRWSDRKGPFGGTLDHVNPSGGNSDDNIVVACRGCNSRKGRRSPTEAGMQLMPPPDGNKQIGTKSDLVPIQADSIHPSPSRTPKEYVSAETNTSDPCNQDAPREQNPLLTLADEADLYVKRVRLFVRSVDSGMRIEDVPEKLRAGVISALEARAQEQDNGTTPGTTPDPPKAVPKPIPADQALVAWLEEARGAKVLSWPRERADAKKLLKVYTVEEIQGAWRSMNKEPFWGKQAGPTFGQMISNGAGALSQAQRLKQKREHARVAAEITGQRQVDENAGL